MTRFLLTLAAAIGLSTSIIGCGNPNTVEVSEQEVAEDPADSANMSEEDIAAEEALNNAEQ